MGEDPRDEAGADPGKPLWVDPDWWRELLRARDKETAPLAEPPAAADPGPPERPDGRDGPLEGAPPASQERAVPSADAEPPAQRPDVFEASSGTAGATPSVAEGAATPPAPAEEGTDHPPPPFRATPSTGAPAPPAVPRGRRGTSATEPPAPDPVLHVPRVRPLAPTHAVPPPVEAPETGTGLPSAPDARPLPLPLPVPLPPVGPSTSRAARDGRPRVVEFLLRHLGDLALLLIAVVVMTLVYLVLGR